MYSLIIAEDEYTTRRALVNMIRWEELGFKVDGEFSDGQEILEYLKNNTPDVILTDIKMVNVSGIEIARFIAEHNLPIRVVFLSAYRDFSFAQEAVEYQVAHYLVKPVDLSKLRDVFRSIKEKLDRQATRENILQNRLDHYNRLVNLEKQQFVTDVYFGSLSNPDQIAKRLELIDSEGNKNLFLVRIVVHNDLQYQRFLEDYGLQELQEQLVHILGYFDEKLEFYPIIWSNTNDDKLTVVGVFWENASGGKKNYCSEVLEDTIYNLLAIHTEVTTFLRLQSPAELKHYTEWNNEHEQEEELIRNVEYLQVLQEQNKLLYSFVCQKQQEQGIELVEALVNNYLRGGCAFAQRQCVYTVTKLIDEVAGHDMVVVNHLYTSCMTFPLFSMMLAEELKVWMERCIRVVFEYAGEKTEKKSDSSMEKVMEYLREHYNEDITLSDIAEKVFLNPAYISRLIKTQTGRNFVDLVMEMRVNHAVELLEQTDMYVYEIAEKVGYNSLKYFYKVFRKVKGKSPSDYR